METYTELRDTLANEGFGEARDLEFKRGGKWKDIKHPVVKAALAMGNLENGGLVVIGVNEDMSGPDRLAGMGEEVGATFNADDVSEFINRYADTPVQIKLRKISEGSRHFVVLDVQGFDYQPIICRKSLDRDGKKYLEEGRVYYRPRGKVESTAQLTHHDMRELLDVAVVKRYNYWRRQVEKMDAVSGMPDVFGKEESGS